MSIPELNKINEQLLQVNSCFRSVFNDITYKNPRLTQKHAATLFNKVQVLLQLGTIEERIKTKELFLGIFRSYVNNMVNAYMMPALKLSHNEKQIIVNIIEKWGHFKRFIFFYSIIFQNASNFYESAFKSLRNMGKSNNISEEDSIFPLPAIALHIYRQVIYESYRRQIQKYIRQEMEEERKGKIAERENVRVLLEIIWSCGLQQTGRIMVKKTPNIKEYQFVKTTNYELIKQYEDQENSAESFMQKEILSFLVEDTSHHYLPLFETKIAFLNPLQDFATAEQLIKNEEERADYYLFSDNQKNKYLQNCFNVLILKNLEERLYQDKSLRNLLQLYIQDPSTYGHLLPSIKLFGRVLFKVKPIIIPLLQTMLKDYLEQFRNRVSEKIGKRKQFIIEVVNVKKAVNKVIDEAWEKDLALCIVRDKCFRKILDGIQVSRNLADFADYKIKQCIKGRYSDEDILQNFKDIFLVMENLTATDSFLIYHQELQGRRLLQSLNEPKLQIQSMLLKIIAEKLGSVSVSSHFNMLRDIENSQEIAENFNKLLAFSSFRWGCRIITPPFWPENTNKNKLLIELPQAVRIHAQTIAGLYHDTYDYRYLNWKLDRGFSLFEGQFPSGKYRFQSENIFLMILLHISQSKNRKILFGNLERKVAPVKEGDQQYLMKCLQVLIDNNLVIRDNANQKQPFTEGEQIKINMKYEPKTPVKQNQTIMIKVSSETQKAMHKSSVEQTKIMKEREKLIEAVLVKLLKHSHSIGENRITFQELYKGIQEHQHLKNFKFSEGIVKQRLEELIAREYCIRNENDKKVYHYIA